MLYIRIGEGSERVMFAIVKSLAVAVLLGTSFIERFIKGIFHSERRIVPSNFPPVSILIMHETETYKTEEQQEDTDTNTMEEPDFTQEQVRIACNVTLKLLSESYVLVTSRAKSIVKLDAFAQFEQDCP